MFDEFIKPTHTASWEGAEMVNKISPAMVENARPIAEHDAVSEFFGYGIGESNSRIPFEKTTNILDVHRAICEGC